MLKFTYVLKNEEDNTYYNGSSTLKEKINQYNHFSLSIYDAMVFDSEDDILEILSNDFDDFQNLIIIKLLSKS